VANKAGKALRICAYDRSPSFCLGSIERDKDRATFLKLGLALPERKVISPLSLIAGVQVTKHDDENRGPSYGITVKLHKGKHFKFGCRSRDQAMALLRTLTKHLAVETRH